MRLNTPVRIVIRIAAIVLVIELLIMFAIAWFGIHLHPTVEALMDASILVLFASPIIYLWIIKPYVVARDHALEKIEHLAYIDPLTQLPNRRLLFEHLEKTIASSKRHKSYGALLLIDLDNFKPINDSFGHDAGDAVLVEIANRLKASSRSEDVVSRLGGDEFVVLVNQIDQDEQKAKRKGAEFADKLQHAIKEPIALGDNVLHINASIGIYLIGTEQVVAHTAMKNADTAMYLAKRSGKGQVVNLDDQDSLKNVDFRLNENLKQASQN